MALRRTSRPRSSPRARGAGTSREQQRSAERAELRADLAREQAVARLHGGEISRRWILRDLVDLDFHSTVGDIDRVDRDPRAGALEDEAIGERVRADSWHRELHQRDDPRPRRYQRGPLGAKTSEVRRLIGAAPPV